jgi:hypothetical protein
MRTSAVLAALALAAAGLAAGCASKKGYQRSEYLADEVHACVASVDAYGTSRQASFESMNALLSEPVEGRPAKFETFNSSVDRVVAADGSLRGSITAMKASAATRFQSWGEENVSYRDADMQVRSQKSRAEAAETFRLAAVDADAMLVQSASFVAYLSDLRRILSNDLSEKGVAGVADFAAKARVSNGHLDEMTRPTRTSLEAAADAMSSKDETK